MMYPRLKLLQKLLSDDGVIFISIDDNEQANLKLICDEIFGENNNIGPIIQSKRNAKNDTLNVQKNHEFILCYRKKCIYLDTNRIKPTLVNTTKETKDAFQEGNKFYYLNDPITTRGEGGTLASRPNLGYTVYYNPITTEKVGVQDYDIENVGKVSTLKELYNDDELLLSNGFVPIRPPKVRGELGCWTWSLDKFNSQNDEIVITGKKNNYSVKKRTFVDSKDVKIINGKLKYIRTKLSNSRSIIEYSTNDGTNLLNNIFGKSKMFDTPKNIEMIEYLMSLTQDKSMIVLDSFAGSGTTAHAILNMNKADGGNRKFILVEMGNYAENITAERVKRVIDGYGEGKNAVEGTGGSFSYYELGEQLLVNGNLNENAQLSKIKEYIWYTETKADYTETKTDNKYYLGKSNDAAYYFYYEKYMVTILDYNFLETVKDKADTYVIYADLCSLSNEELAEYNIIFKKIPRDISKI